MMKGKPAKLLFENVTFCFQTEGRTDLSPEGTCAPTAVATELRYRGTREGGG